MIADLKGKVVLITGASTGIGAAAARAFAHAGSRVAIHYNASRDAAEQVAADVKAAGAEAALVGGDVTVEADVKRIVAETLAQFGRIDVLINNAGGMLGRVKIEDYTVEHIHRVLALNCTQVALFMREALPGMRRQKSGNVINVTSIAARNGGGGGAILYAGSKGFVSTVTHGWAKEVAGDNIRVNAVSPGVITTPFHERYSTPGAAGRDAGDDPDEPARQRGRMRGNFPLPGVRRAVGLRDGAGDRGQRRAADAVAQGQTLA